VTNNFGNATAPPEVKLMRITFQNMFPAINVATVSLKECRRAVLFHMIKEDEEDDNGKKKQRVKVRHYAIKATPVGVNKRFDG
jgi:ribosome biogenesis protein SSF1/2